MYKSSARAQVSLSLSMLVACATLAFGCDDKSVGDYKKGRRDFPWNWRSPGRDRRGSRRLHRWLQRPGRRSWRNRRSTGRDRRGSRRIHRWLQRPGRRSWRNGRCPCRDRRGSRRLHRWLQRPGGWLRNWRCTSRHRRGSRRLRPRWWHHRPGGRLRNWRCSSRNRRHPAVSRGAPAARRAPPELEEPQPGTGGAAGGFGTGGAPSDSGTETKETGGFAGGA